MDELSAAPDVRAYFQRIDYHGTTQPTAETLRGIHLAHATHVPFENLDVLLGITPRLDLPSLQQKLIAERRGGYCFQQNALFAAVLETLGFQVTRLSARVDIGGGRVLPRTHMLLKVDVEGRSWMADVGFGGWGLLEPIPLESQSSLTQGVWKFSLQQDGPVWRFRSPQAKHGPSGYDFTLEPHVPVDYEPANFFCARHPESRFTQTLTAQIAALDRRLMLINRDLLTITADQIQTETLPDEDALHEVLRSRFGLHLPDGSRFGPTRGQNPV